MKRCLLILMMFFFCAGKLLAQNALDQLLKSINAGTPVSQERASIVGAGNRATSARTRSTKPDSLHPWVYGGNLKLSLSQASFSDWASGGENSAAGAFTADIFWNYGKNKLTWYNYFYGTYGQIFRKSISTKLDDLFEFTTKLDQEISSKLFVSQALNLRSQFADGYNYGKDTVKVSGLFAPAYLYIKIGVDYKPTPGISLVFSPLMGKGTFVSSDDQSIRKRYGMEEVGLVNEVMQYKNKKYEFGGGLTISINQNLAKNVKITSVCDMFSNYLKSPQNINVDWRLKMEFTVNRYIAADLSLRSIYDPNIVVEQKGPRLQLMQTMSVGFTYNLDPGEGWFSKKKKE